MIERAAVILKSATMMLAVPLVLGGCASRPEKPVQLVEINTVLNEIKSELNASLPYLVRAGSSTACGQDLSPRTVVLVPDGVTLTFQIAVSEQETGSLKVGVIPLGSSELTVGGNRSDSISSVRELQLEFATDELKAKAQELIARQASGAPGSTLEQLPPPTTQLAMALNQVANALLSASGTSPCLKPTRLSTSLVYGVKWVDEVGGKIKFILAETESKSTITTEQRQSIKFSVDMTGSSPILQ